VVNGQSREVCADRERLLRWQENALQEEAVAEKVYAHILSRGFDDDRAIHRLVSSRSLFNGDVVLTARGPAGLTRVLVGDFTGHGLGAAIAALPASEVFYSMTRKGFSVSEVVSELNVKLGRLLPRGMFCAAVVYDVDLVTRQLTAWNGGMHDVLVMRQGSLRARIPSTHPPLGVLQEGEFSPQVRHLELQEGDRVLAYTDGVLEAMGLQGERFGQARLERAFLGSEDAESFLTELTELLAEFCGDGGQADDITVLEFDVSGATSTLDSSGDLRPGNAPSTWQVELRLAPDALRTSDPVSMVIETIMGMQGLHAERRRLSTVVAELYSNALHHGLLKVDGGLRTSPEGFVAYMESCRVRLAALNEGEIRVRLRHRPRPDGGLLEIEVEDTGDGFDFTRPPNPDVPFGGRGRALVEALCEEVRYEGAGNRVVARYGWHRGDAEVVT
jgi:hypothetical protein